MTWLLWIVAVFLVFGSLAYRRAPLALWTTAVALFLTAATVIGVGGLLLAPVWIVFAAVAIVLHSPSLRQRFVTGPILDVFRKVLPPMSATEREAIEAGTVWWDAELFSGKPDWQRLLSTPVPTLSEAEQAFVDGPVEQLCKRLDDWAIDHEHEGLPEEIWAFLKQHGFFGMIIPKEYGGLGFSALGHSAVVMKVSSASGTAGVVVMVPNSLGPAELLLQYGTEEQKRHYLPRLARGEDIPCFGLTGPEAGSDAGAMPDRGVVCRQDFQGQKDVLGIRLHWDKRYITLAPVATLLGLAFKLDDPDHLLGEDEELGITVALIPTDTPGVTTGRRHRPMGMAFYNGPTQGVDVFIPVDWIIGGRDMAGKGWMMLVECLAAGRSISLPALSAASGKVASQATGAYAAVRQQFNTAIGNFEGVQEALARIGGHAYAIDAARTMTAGAVDLGEKPSVLSAIIKYHATERMRGLVNDAMDVHGGRAISRGPRNYLARPYIGIPVAITVEGANILTRNLIIFGQGAIRCHPYVLREMEAAREPDRTRALADFDAAFRAHCSFVASNKVRAWWLGVTGARFVSAPVSGRHRRYYQQLTRMSAAFAYVSDVAMLVLGGKLKRIEGLSARLGDVLSGLYIASAALKRYEDQGRPEADQALLDWVCQDALFRIQTALEGFLQNFPNRWLAASLRPIVFPLGRPYAPPSDRLNRRVATLLQRPSEARDRLIGGTFVGTPEHPIGRIEDAFIKVAAARPIAQKLRHAVKAGTLKTRTTEARIEEALGATLITEAEAELLRLADAARQDAIAVDDFAPEEFGNRHTQATEADVSAQAASVAN